MVHINFQRNFYQKVFLIYLIKKIPLYGTGENIREWIYVGDTCEAIYKVVQNFKNKQTFNIGSSQRFSNISILKKLFKQLDYSIKMLNTSKMNQVMI